MPAEVWENAESLERYVGRWSRLVAREFVAWLQVPPGSRWLDVGCGSGALTETVLAEAEPESIEGVDTSEAFVAYAASRVTDPRASFAVADAQALDRPDAAYDAVASSLVLNFLPDPARGAAEMRRVARPGGVVAGYVWDYAGEMQLMLFLQGSRDAFAQPDLLAETVEALGDRATLVVVEGGDHSFRVRGVKADDRTIGASLAGEAAPFVRRIAGAR